MNSTLAVDTKICAWGNSSALRLPRNVLKVANLSPGDEVSVGLNEAGHIEITPKTQSHRRVRPMRGITFDSLFAGYDGGTASSGKGPEAWPDGNMVGAEWDAWRS